MTEAEYTLESKLWKAIKDDRTVMLALAGVEEGHSQPMTAQRITKRMVRCAQVQLQRVHHVG